MKLTKRRETEPATADASLDAAGSDATTRAAGKGRATPKRRDVTGPRGPVTPPRTRKEAYARQKEQAKAARTARKSAPSSKMTVAERRAALRAGDPTMLPRRDQGATRKLARDYVDSHRMLSNYLLLLFPLMIFSYLVPLMQLVVLVGFLAFLAEWIIVGRRIRALSIERTGSAQGGALGVGFYAGSRAYLPRKWRMPAPQVSLGDPI